MGRWPAPRAPEALPEPPLVLSRPRHGRLGPQVPSPPPNSGPCKWPCLVTPARTWAPRSGTPSSWGWRCPSSAQIWVQILIVCLGPSVGPHPGASDELGVPGPPPRPQPPETQELEVTEKPVRPVLPARPRPLPGATCPSRACGSPPRQGPQACRCWRSPGPRPPAGRVRLSWGAPRSWVHEGRPSVKGPQALRPRPQPPPPAKTQGTSKSGK